MNRNVKANRVCDDWTVIFLQSVLDELIQFFSFSKEPEFNPALCFLQLFRQSKNSYLSAQKHLQLII